MSASRYSFQVQSFDVDAFNVLAAPRLLGYLIESSIRSADELGFGIARLQTEGLTWVISRTRVQLEDALVVGDELEIETWPSGLKRSAVLRDFRIRRSGHLVGRATSVWFVLDLESRLPQRPHEFVPTGLHPLQKNELDVSVPIPALTGSADIERSFRVRYSDIDLNLHVTAATYVGWAVECIAPGEWQECRLAELDVHFLEECHLGHDILSRSATESPSARLHRIVRSSDSREIARLRTVWVARGGKPTPR